MDNQFVLRLGAVMPDFPCEMTNGNMSFHTFCDSNPKCPWTMLFTHPKDYTPVCTTELAEMQKMHMEFAKLGVKVIGLSCDSAEEHRNWSQDIMNLAGCNGNELSYPIIADPKRDLVTQLGMLDPEEKDKAGLPLPARALIILGAKKEIKLMIIYPASTGRNYAEVLRTIQSLRLAAENPGCATPVNWKFGDRVIVAPSESIENAKKNYKNVEIVKVKTPASTL